MEFLPDSPPECRRGQVGVFVGKRPPEGARARGGWAGSDLGCISKPGFSRAGSLQRSQEVWLEGQGLYFYLLLIF